MMIELEPVNHAMSEPHYVDQRPLPASTFQMGAQAVGDVTAGLRRTPLMLGVVILNLLGIVAAVYFLNVLIKGQQLHMTEVINAEDKQFKALIDMHSREFDALLSLAERSLVPLPPIPGPSQRGPR